MEKIYKRVEYSNENFRKNINYLITRDNVTKSFLDNSLEIGEGSLSRYCKVNDDVIEPKIGIVNSLAKSFGVTIDNLINGDVEKKEKEILENSQRKEVLFCKKLIEKTKINLCDWKYYDFYNSEIVEDNGTFESKFMYESFDIRDLNGYTVTINSNVEGVIIEHPLYETGEGGNISARYELYLVKENGGILPSCASHRYNNELSKVFEEGIIYDEVLDNVLKELYKVAADYVAFGKDNFEKEYIYEEYIYGIPF